MDQVTNRVRIGFVMRLVAAIVDGVVAAALVFLPTLLLAAVIGPKVAGIVGGLLAMAYYALEVVKAQSLGKMVFSYTITAQDGSPATRDQLIKRYAYKQVPQVLGILAAVPFLGLLSFVGFAAAIAIAAGALLTLKPDKLALHDKLFGTAVFGPANVTVTVPFLNKQLFTIPAAAAPAPATVPAAVSVPAAPAAA